MVPRYIDIHSHLNFPEYDADRAEVLARMRDLGVWTITVGTDLPTSQSALALAKGQEGIFAAIGLHPHDNMDEIFDYEVYKKIALDPKVVAIGECGLDYSRLKEFDNEKRNQLVQRQKQIFSQQIALANELGKPLMLHIRDAYEDAYEILKAEAKVKGDVHFFAGNWEIAQKFIELGFTLSFTGVITFARNYDEVVKNMPSDMILSETDCPFVSPVPYRGKRNEPTYVSNVVKKIADIRGEDEEKMAQILVKNAIRVFSLS